MRGALVTLPGPNNTLRAGVTDADGRYRADALTAGAYTVRVVSPGFEPFQSGAIPLQAGATQTMNVRLEIQQVVGQVTVSDEANAVNVDPSRNAGQLTLRGSDLDALSDNAEDLANDLQMLAGPAPGRGDDTARNKTNYCADGGWRISSTVRNGRKKLVQDQHAA